MRPGVSLANKCLLLFGGVIVLVVLAAASVPWLRMNALVDEGQEELSRQMVASWERVDRDHGASATGEPVERAGVVARRLTLDEARALAATDPFVARALREFEREDGAADAQDARWKGTAREYRYARAVRSAGSPGSLEGIVLLDRKPVQASRLLLVNIVYLLSAGSVILGIAVLAFYLITHKLILGPVRALKETAERVRAGNLATRSEIETGDEFQELAETFNFMLGDLQAGSDQLRSINAALDLKVNELIESNVALYDAAKLKGEFLASISHELRTPLNSIIGFAELMAEIARAEQSARAEAGEEIPVPLAKRLRYADNIVSAARNLLEMINGLLEMARIEAGRVELHVDRVNLREACESLAGLIHPLADRKGIAVRLEIAEDLPPVSTDVKKFQQIVFNFLSNAVKFTEPQERTGRAPQVTLRAERLVGGGAGHDAERVRVSVIDNGPGIPADQHERIFDKFHQLEGGHTREHAGTGLGLAIARELASILQGEIQLVSDVGRGSMFSLILPRELDPSRVAETNLEARFRGALGAKRAWRG